MAAIFAKTLFLTDSFPAFDLRESVCLLFFLFISDFLNCYKPDSQKSHLNALCKIFLAVAEMSPLVLGGLFLYF